MGMDLEGFAVSSGSACNSGSILPSHVLLAMGFDKIAAGSALRVSLGYENTEAEIEAFVGALERVVGRIRQRVSNAPAETLG
jgi:cysteine desulfurase